MNQLYIYICSHISSLLCLPPTLPIPPLLVVTKHLADLPVLCGCFPLAIYFTFGSVYMSMPLSHFVPAYPSPSLCPQVHSLRLRLYSCDALLLKHSTLFHVSCFSLCGAICQQAEAFLPSLPEHPAARGSAVVYVSPHPTPQAH